MVADDWLYCQASGECRISCVENFEQEPDLIELAKTSFGNAVKAFRLANNWTQDDLARNLTAKGVRASQTIVAKIERGDRPTPITEAAVLAALFGIPIQSLFPMDKSSATGSYFGGLLTDLNHQIAILDARREAVRLAEDQVRSVLDAWDEAVGELTDDEREDLKAIDIDARPSGETGLRDRVLNPTPADPEKPAKAWKL